MDGWIEIDRERERERQNWGVGASCKAPATPQPSCRAKDFPGHDLQNHGERTGDGEKERETDTHLPVSAHVSS